MFKKIAKKNEFLEKYILFVNFQLLNVLFKQEKKRIFCEKCL